MRGRGKIIKQLSLIKKLKMTTITKYNKKTC